MSYDVDLYVDLGGPERSYIAIDDYLNYTYNVGPMFRLAIPERAGERGLFALKDLDAGEAAQILDRAIVYMREHETEMRALDPPNGWGDYESAREFLERIRAVCVQHPRARLHVT